MEDFPVDAMVKNPLASAGDTRAVVLIPGWGRSPGEGNGNPLPLLAWRIAWTEEPDGPQPTGLHGVGRD